MYRLKKAESFIEFKNGKSIKPEKDGVYPIYGANGVIGMSSKYREENSVVIGRVGAYCGSVQFCKGKYWASDNTIVAYPKNSDTYIVFLYYLLKNSNLSRWAGGSAQPLITQTLIRQIELHYTNINNQHKIASILSAYDDLIENNTKRIKILEQMADAIYKEWFIKFRFPGYEKVKFVNSELGKIPEGWEV
ncbi:MAG TPA: restriction endonuclease subunit S, partial [Elusimicrobiales bacterium]|nr:restriction endonuclease subunit S [Elusimicrobiales bacterium]